MVTDTKVPMNLFQYHSHPKKLLHGEDQGMISFDHNAPFKSKEEALIKLRHSPEKLLSHAMYVIGDRWPEAEPYILKDPEAVIAYAMIYVPQ